MRSAPAPPAAAGAFVARADDVTAVSINPAGLAELDGTVIQVGNQFSYNGYDYTRAPTLDWGNAQNGTAPTVAFAKVHNGTPWQAALPFIGAVVSPRPARLGLRAGSLRAARGSARSSSPRTAASAT